MQELDKNVKPTATVQLSTLDKHMQALLKSTFPPWALLDWSSISSNLVTPQGGDP